MNSSDRRIQDEDMSAVLAARERDHETPVERHLALLGEVLKQQLFDAVKSARRRPLEPDEVITVAEWAVALFDLEDDPRDTASRIAAIINREVGGAARMAPQRGSQVPPV